MTKRNLPQPFGVDKIHFRDCFIAPSLRHFVGSNLQKTSALHQRARFSKNGKTIGHKEATFNLGLASLHAISIT